MKVKEVTMYGTKKFGREIPKQGYWKNGAQAKRYIIFTGEFVMINCKIINFGNSYKSSP
jgi:hypothetical protein